MQSTSGLYSGSQVWALASHPAVPGQMLAGTDGVLFARRRNGELAWPGMVAFRIAGAKPLTHRKGMSGLDD